MSNELVISATQNGSRIALLKNKELLEYHREDDNRKFTVGEIYLGTVRKIVQGLNATFINVDYEKDGFLHYQDLGPKIQSLNKYIKQVKSRNEKSEFGSFKLLPDIDKHGKISDILIQNQKILVQVVKEPISTKGPRLSCELSLAGRYIVLVPFSNTISISKKITDSDENKRLVRLLKSITPENFGVIIRTVAEGKSASDLHADLDIILHKWKKGMELLRHAKANEVIISEISQSTSLLRDVLNEDFDSIIVDSKDRYDEIQIYLKQIAPSKEKILKYYNNKVKLFESLGLEKQIKLMFGRSVSVRGGGYLIIEHTEALHVIDVNSGNKSNKEENQEATALAVNIEATIEIARQLRLRDMGGIIVIDFIDLRKVEHKKLLEKKMKDEMEGDRSKHTILPLSKFGLMQITRQRVRPEVTIKTAENCPTCKGTGLIIASISIAGQIEDTIKNLLEVKNESKISLIVHPYLSAYFKKGFFSIQLSLWFKYYKWITIIEDTSLAITEYRFLNAMKEKIIID